MRMMLITMVTMREGVCEMLHGPLGPLGAAPGLAMPQPLGKMPAAALMARGYRHAKFCIPYRIASHWWLTPPRN